MLSSFKNLEININLKISIFIRLIEEGRRLYLHQPRESGKQGLDQKRFANIFH